jgi:pimeloyl-ACP methyl ester carboxylesterase
LCARTLQHPQAGALMKALLASTFDRMPKRLMGTLNDIEQLDTADAYPLAEIAPPVMVLHGTEDRIVSFSHGASVARIAPTAELMAIEGGERVSLFTHLDEIRVRVDAFLARHANN